MNLKKKKIFAAKVLKVGKDRILFNKERLADIKEALTRQDILDLLNDGAILIREIKGRKKIVKRKTRRRKGSIRKSPKNKKRKYVLMVRNLRSYIKQLKKQGKITKEQYYKLRKEIRASLFKDKAHLKERIKLFNQ
ncbi:MAG: hypothetical protein N3D20_00085 [Candidatus Pacearchaeota archaeon]|nr:hypothetical protein [Candidatus Pacearchaeota archaeon]